ncbi:MAG: hypothetical protein C0498_07225 [Anaerolinea sp.]|nr:hypothetical protein [Anaerolinea sp.]
MNGDRAPVRRRASIARALHEAVRRGTATEAGVPAGSSTFLRGLAIGALVGAAIAGSALRNRRRPTRESRTGR